MTFAAPWMLLGLLAIGVPVAVHLINRRRAQRVRFPAMRLLLQSKQRVARGLKLKQWLLLALRVGVFGLLPLAMAQPLVRCGGGAASSQDDRLPASVAVVVDAVPLENFWDREKPLFESGPIQLQTHGGEIRWRNIFVREIDPAQEASQ